MVYARVPGHVLLLPLCSAQQLDLRNQQRKFDIAHMCSNTGLCHLQALLITDSLLCSVQSVGAIQFRKAQLTSIDSKVSCAGTSFLFQVLQTGQSTQDFLFGTGQQALMSGQLLATMPSGSDLLIPFCLATGR